MKKDDTVYLHHILDAIGLIEEYTKEMSENEFLGNSMAHDAIVWDTVQDDLPLLKKSIKKIL
jgi:uncharacterized protein with HEPN domain